MRTPVFLDHHSTTPLDPRVLDAMLPYLRRCGNASSRTHAWGWEASEAVEGARAQVAAALGADPGEIVFTSGATESDNLALAGICATGHLLVGATEHVAVLDPAARLEEKGVEVTRLPVDGTGRVDPDAVDAALRADTVLVSVMAANNEVGTLHPLREIGHVTRSRGVLLHTDAAQAFGRVPLDVRRIGVDLVSLSAHKIHGPMGVGALWVRRGVESRLRPQTTGGGHERGLRAGTHNVAGIVGFGMAAELASTEREDEGLRLAKLRDRLLEIVRAGVDGVRVNGHPHDRLPNNLHVSIEGIDGESLLARLDDVGASTGSACSSARGKPSHVLAAMGVAPERARSSIRFGLGRFTTGEEIEHAAGRVVAEVQRLRELSGRMP